MEERNTDNSRPLIPTGLDEPRPQFDSLNVHNVEPVEVEKISLQSEEWYRNLVQSQGEGIGIVDPDERFIFANPAAEAIFGVPTGGLVGHRLDEYLDQKSFEKAQKQTKNRKKGEKSVYELEITRPDRQKRTLQLTATPWFNEKHEFIGAFGILVDITGRVKTEQSLREGERRYRKLYDAAQRAARELALLERVRAALAGELDLTELYRIIVEATAEAFGYTLVSIYLLEGEALKLQHQVGYISVLYEIPITKGIVGRVARTGKPMLVSNVKKDHDFLDAHPGIKSEVCVPLIYKNKVVGIFNIESQETKLTEDDLRLMVTLSEHIIIAIARARLYTNLSESEASYRTLAKNLPGMVYRIHLDEGWRMEFYNTMLKEISGYEPVELKSQGMARSIDELILEEERQSVIESIHESIKNNQPFEIEYRIKHKNGSLRNCVERGRPVYAADGSPSHIDGVIMDSTEQKKAEAAGVRYAREMETLYEVSLAINAQTDLSNLLDAIVESATRLLDAEMGALYLLKPDGETLEMVISYNFPKDFSGTEISLGEGIAGRVAQTGEPMAVPDYSAWEGKSEFIAQSGLRRVLGVPLKYQGKVIGVLEIADQVENRVFSIEQLRLASLFTEQAAIAVENARLYSRLERQAVMDELTNLYNRRGLLDLGRREVERAIRFNRPLSALFIDIDHFKLVNDRYSHAIGDQVLQFVASILRSTVREVDVVARYGGEEFVILLVETDIQSAYQTAERLRKQFEQTPTATTHGEIGVKISVGVAQLEAGRPSLAVLIDRADRAMYGAKMAGRNCVVIGKPTTDNIENS